MSGKWANSTRRSRLPADWPKIRARILQRDPLCRLAYDCCTGRSTEVDHVVRGDNHADHNLQGVCSECHKRKTQAEKPQRKRPPEQHPGRLT